jgi:hypothetical protein
MGVVMIRSDSTDGALGDEAAESGWLCCSVSEVSCLVGYSKCHVTSNKAKSNLECAEEKFQTRGWVRGCEK